MQKVGQPQGSKLTWTVDHPQTVPDYNNVYMVQKDSKCQKFCPKMNR